MARHRRYAVSIALVRTCLFLSLLLCPVSAAAQSLGFGFGLGLPLMNYITDEVGRDYRVTPEPGYYPVLKNLENAYGSVHFNISLLLNFDLPVDVEARFDVSRMRWRRSVVTHVSCTSVDVIDGKYSDANADYYPLNKVDKACLNTATYRKTEDISSENRASLWFFHISGGARYSFFKIVDWNVFAGGHLGFTIVNMSNKGTWFGGNLDAILGVMYRLSELIWVEFDVKLLFALTQTPDDSQIRINHETQTGGNILTSLIQPESYIDFQLSIRFDFSDL